MELEDSPLVSRGDGCCDCRCGSCNINYSGTFIRSVKRKLDESEEEVPFTIPGFIVPQNARIDMGNECMALREMVSSQQQTIQDLSAELEEERNASSSATNEAMSMILRLQREKADIQMEARQFKRFAEEKMAHDQEEILELDDLLYKREEIIESLTCEVQAYKHRMMSYGLTEVEADGDRGISRNASMIENGEGDFEFPREAYPLLKCNSNESEAYDDVADDVGSAENYTLGETPRSYDQLKDLENRIDELERAPRTFQNVEELIDTNTVQEKVIFYQPTSPSKHLRKPSTESSTSLCAMGEKKFQDLATDSPKFQDLATDSPKFQDLATDSPKFQDLATDSPKFQDLATDCPKSQDLATDSPKSQDGFYQPECVILDENSETRKVEDTSDNGDDMTDRVYTIDSVCPGVSLDNVVDRGAPIDIYGADCIMTSGESPNCSSNRAMEIQKLYARLNALEADRESMRQAIVSIGTEKAQLVLLKEIAQNLCKEMSPTERTAVQKQPIVRSLSLVSIFKWLISFVFRWRKARRCKYTFGMSANNAGLLTLLDKSPRMGQWRSISSV